MSIQSASEFEAVINHVSMRIDRALSERGAVPALEEAARDLHRVLQVARQPAKLKALRSVIDKVTDVITENIPNDNVVLEQMWDLGDFVDYRA
jgi:hypothetical protein